MHQPEARGETGRRVRFYVALGLVTAATLITGNHRGLGFGIIRFISLHEVDAWNAHAPWARTAVDLVAAAGVSAVAIARLYRLRDARNR